MKKLLKTNILGILVGFINGLLGSGGGTLLVPSLERLLKVEEHKAHATAISIILPLSIISSIVYIKSSVVEFRVLLYVSIGGIVGGFVGAKLLGKLTSKWLHKIFGIVMIIAAIRMMFS